MTEPLKSYSWEILSERVAVKHMDKSAFLHHGTGIPKDIAFFFNLNTQALKRPKPTTLLYCGNSYATVFQLDKLHSRFRLFWKGDFTQQIKSRFPDFHRAFSQDERLTGNRPLMRFEKLSDDCYEVDMILADVIAADIEAEIQEEAETRQEGAEQKYYGKRYERDPKNRRDAIKHHGLKCKACGFHFPEAYGERGQGFIEIHHVNPLAASGKPQDVNPKTDLVPLCANCHRMVHRFPKKVLSVEELKVVVVKQNLIGGGLCR